MLTVCMDRMAKEDTVIHTPKTPMDAIHWVMEGYDLRWEEAPGCARVSSVHIAKSGAGWHINLTAMYEGVRQDYSIVMVEDVS